MGRGEEGRRGGGGSFYHSFLSEAVSGEVGLKKEQEMLLQENGRIRGRE